MKTMNRVDYRLSAGDRAKQQTASQHIFTAVSKLEAGLTERQTHGLRSRYSPQITIRRFIFERIQTCPPPPPSNQPVHRNHNLVERVDWRISFREILIIDSNDLFEIARRKREKKKKREKTLPKV